MRSFPDALAHRTGRARGPLRPPLFLALALLWGATRIAQGQSAADSSAVDTLISSARACLKNGDYDQAAQSLKSAISRAAEQPSQQREGYLLLVQSYVMRGNFYKSELQGREASELFYREARRYVEECLAVPRQRHLRPEPSTEYPPEMVELFRKVRTETLGSFRILKLTPPDATVLLGEDTLRASPADSILEEQDLQAGSYRVVIRRPGYQDLDDLVQIGPGTATERTYALRHKHGVFWYGTRSAVLAGGVAAGLIVRARESAKTPVPPLGAPPGGPR